MNYIKISEKNTGKVNYSFLQKLVLILTSVFPKANPDFDDKIDDVAFWLLEFENNLTAPNREIGLDASGGVIMKMPYMGNYGYWVDNNLTYNDFVEKFQYETISEKEFESKWLEFLDLGIK